jgi:hypothetical protein
LESTGEIVANQRVYLIGTPDSKVRLVKASIRSQALNHVANSMFTVRVATQDDLIEHLTSGVPVEMVRDGEQLNIE